MCRILVLNILYIFKHGKFDKCPKYECFEVGKKIHSNKNSIKTKFFNYCVAGNKLI